MKYSFSVHENIISENPTNTINVILFKCLLAMVLARFWQMVITLDIFYRFFSVLLFSKKRTEK